MMGTIRSMISFFHRTPSSSTHQSNPAHPPPYFPISEEIPGLVALMCTFFSWSLWLLCPPTATGRWADRWSLSSGPGMQGLLSFQKWKYFNSKLPTNRWGPSTCHPLPGAISQSQDPTHSHLTVLAPGAWAAGTWTLGALVSGGVRAVRAPSTSVYLRRASRRRRRHRTLWAERDQERQERRGDAGRAVPLLGLGWQESALALSRSALAAPEPETGR